MAFSLLKLAVACAVICLASGFSVKPAAFRQKAVVSKTILFEDFNLDFANPTIISSRELFSEKQLREWTATYSVDERGSVLDGLFAFVGGIFAKKEETKSSPNSNSPNVAGLLRPSVSIAVLEEKTALFVKGQTDAKTYYAVLKAAFGDKLGSVLPQIIANLPAKKAAELTKVSA